MQNKLIDLNNHLFEQLERLQDDEICKDKESTMQEIARAKAVCDISGQIIDIHSVQLEAIRISEEYNCGVAIPKTLSLE